MNAVSLSSCLARLQWNSSSNWAASKATPLKLYNTKRLWQFRKEMVITGERKTPTSSILELCVTACEFSFSKVDWEFKLSWSARLSSSRMPEPYMSFIVSNRLQICSAAWAICMYFYSSIQSHGIELFRHLYQHTSAFVVTKDCISSSISFNWFCCWVTKAETVLCKRSSCFDNWAWNLCTRARFPSSMESLRSESQSKPGEIVSQKNNNFLKYKHTNQF